MSLPVDFMQRVVEWPAPSGAGYINCHWKPPPDKNPGMRGRPFKNITEFMEFVQFAACKPANYAEIYFCLSTQQQAGKVVSGRNYNFLTAHRNAAKAMFLKSLWLDVDVKNDPKHYQTLPEALAAVTAFTTDAGLPPPSALVLTGGGVHVYWFSDNKLTLAEWTPYAEALKAEALRYGLKCDAGLTADPARVLRVPGTFNNKIRGNARPVKLAHLGPGYDFTTHPQFQALAAKAPAKAVTAAVTLASLHQPAFDLPEAFANGPSPAFAHLDPTDNLSNGISRNNSDLPLNPAEVFRGCHHFQQSFTTHGANQSQGLWMLTGLASTWLDNGRKIFHTLSKGYAAYDHGETDLMYDRKVTERTAGGLGWPSCQAFEGEGAKCKTCPFYGKLKSPLNLAERVVPPGPSQPSIQQIVAVEELELPDNYTVNAKGWICEIVTTQKGDETIDTEVPLFMSKLRNFVAQGGAEPCLRFETSLDGNRWGKVRLDEKVDLINDMTIIKALRMGRVKPYTRDPGNARRIITFVTSFMEKLDDAKRRLDTLSFGWLRASKDSELITAPNVIPGNEVIGGKPTGFAYGGKVYMLDGTERGAGTTDPRIEGLYTPSGSSAPWWEMLRMVTAQNSPAREAIICSAFAAPLMVQAGQYNGLMCAFSNGSGARKSTSMQIATSVWSNPKMTKERPSTSPKGLMKKMGIIQSLPLVWDEINRPELMENVISIIGDLTEGATGTKLTSGRTVAEYSDWQTCMVVGANLSLTDQIMVKVKNTDASMQRVFEFEVDKTPGTGDSAVIDRTLNSLDYNYGHMGALYAKYIAENYDACDKFVLATRQRFYAETNSDEIGRFRNCMASALYAGATFANACGCDFHLPELWEFLKVEYLKQNQKIKTAPVIAGTYENVINVYTEFMKAFADNILQVGKMGTTNAVTHISGPSKIRPRAIYVRMSVPDRTIDLSKTKFSQWLNMNGNPANMIISGLMRHYGAVELPRVLMATGSGLPGGAPEPVIRIPALAGGPFEPDLVAGVPPDQLPPAVTAAVTPPVTSTAA